MDKALQYIPAITALVAVISLALALRGKKRTDTQDTAQEVKEKTVIETKLDTLIRGFDELRLEFRDIKRTTEDHEKRLLKIETRCEMNREHDPPDKH